MPAATGARRILLSGGVQGLVVTKPDAPFGLPLSQDMWLYYFTLVISLAIYVASVNLLKSRSGRVVSVCKSAMMKKASYSCCNLTRFARLPT